MLFQIRLSTINLGKLSESFKQLVFLQASEVVHRPQDPFNAVQNKKNSLTLFRCENCKESTNHFFGVKNAKKVQFINNRFFEAHVAFSKIDFVS